MATVTGRFRVVAQLFPAFPSSSSTTEMSISPFSLVTGVVVTDPRSVMSEDDLERRRLNRRSAAELIG